MSKWYYTQGGQRQGPVTGEKLKGLAASGQLAPTDLVWKEGASQWVEAQKVKGLLPARQVTPPPAPPPLPGAPPAGPTTPPGMQAPPVSSPASLAVAPPLWNPSSLCAVSFLFSWAFGAYILAQNWRALGEVANAKRAMLWLWGLFPLLILAAVLPDTVASKGIWLTSLAILTAFYWLEIRPQIHYVKERFDNQFPHRSWWKPMGIVSAGVTALILLSLLVSESNVTLVKEGHLEAYPDVTIGEAVDKFLANPQWEAVEGSNGREYVTVRGGAEFMGRPVQLALQFRVNPDSGRFKVYALEIDGCPQNQLVTIGLLSKIFDDDL